MSGYFLLVRRPRAGHLSRGGAIAASSGLLATGLAIPARGGCGARVWRGASLTWLRPVPAERRGTSSQAGHAVRLECFGPGIWLRDGSLLPRHAGGRVTYGLSPLRAFRAGRASVPADFLKSQLAPPWSTRITGEKS